MALEIGFVVGGLKLSGGWTSDRVLTLKHYAGVRENYHPVAQRPQASDTSEVEVAQGSLRLVCGNKPSSR